MNHPLRSKISRRLLFAALLALLMLLPFICVPESEAAPVPDGITSAITIYRWKKIADPYSYLQNKKNSGEIFMTWTDNDQLYYSHYPLGDKWKNHWEGSGYNGNMVLNDNLVSSQPVIKDVLDNGVSDFISETQMECGLWFGIAMDDTLLGFGSNVSDGALCYDSDGGGLTKPSLEEYELWVPEKVNDSTIRFESAIKLHETKDTTKLRHNGNRIYAGRGGSGANTYFSNFYSINPIEISAVSKNYSIANGQVLPVDTSVYIPKNVTLTVKNGATLSVGGQLLNDGKIVVEKGGLVVVKVGASIMPLTRNDPACGAFVSDGTVVVRRNGRLIGGGSTGLWFNAGGVTNFGILASETFYASQIGIIENRTGGAVYSGKTIGTAKFYECVCAYLDKKTPPANSKFGESSFQTKQSSGAVMIASGAVDNKGGTYKDFGSFGTTENPVITVKTRTGSSQPWVTMLMAYENEIGYYQSKEIHVTTREYLENTGFLGELRSQYVSVNGSEAGFEQYLADYCTENAISLESWVNVYNGIFTVNGKTVLTVPWYEEMTVLKGSEVIRENTFPWKVPAIWGDGTRPDDAPDVFADAPLLDQTFFIEIASAPGMRLEVAGGGVKDGDNVRVWSAQDADHMRWTFREGEVYYRNGEKLYYYYIVNLKSGMVMHITSASYAAEGQNIRQSAKKNAPFQQLFRVEQNRDGTYRIIPRGDDNFSMETNNGGTVNGSNVQVGTSGVSTNRWKLIRTEESPYVGKTFEIEPVCAPDMRLEIKDMSTYYGSGTGNAQIGTYNKNQTFRFDKAEIVYENGEMHYYYFIVPAHWKHQLTTANLPAASGNNVYQGQANSNKARQWRIIDNGDGTVCIVPRTNASLRLNVEGGGTAPGTNVNVTNSDGSLAQKWWIFPVGGSHFDTPTSETEIPGEAVLHNKVFEIESAASAGKVAEVENGSESYGSSSGKVLLGNDADKNYQRWRFRYAETVEAGGNTYVYYYIVAEHSGHAMMPNNVNPTAEGTIVIQSELGMYPEQQKWRVIDNGDGTYGLVTKPVQGVQEARLSLQNGSAKAGAQLITAPADDSTAQKWKLNPVG